MAIQRGNAIGLMSTIPPEKELKDIFHLKLLFLYNIYVYIRYFVSKIINTLI